MADTIDQTIYDSLLVAIESINGPLTYVEDKELFAYIEDGQRMRVPDNFHFGHDYVSNAAISFDALPAVVGINADSRILGNDRKLVARIDVGNLTPFDLLIVIACANIDCFPVGEDAIGCALLRATLAVRGCLLPYVTPMANNTRNSRHVYVDEVYMINEVSVNAVVKKYWKQVYAYFVSEKGKFILRNWTYFLSALDYVFMTRGHHFVGESVSELVVRTPGATSGRYTYSQLYDALFKASFPGETAPIADNKTLFRVALHPFGVNVARQMHVLYASHKHLPAGMRLRSMPAPAGLAKVTTAAAIIRMMQGSPMLMGKMGAFNVNAKVVLDAAKIILANPEGYHQAKTLFHFIPDAKEDVEAVAAGLDMAISLAPVLVGYVRSECKDAPISKQKTLDKPAEDQAGLLRRVEQTFNSLDAAANAENPQVALSLIVAGPGVQRGAEGYAV